MSDAEELFPPINFEEKQGEPTPEAAEAKAEEQPKPEHVEQTVPLAALKEARGENRTLRQQIAEIREMLQAQNRPPAPDPIADPEAHSAFLMQQMQQAQANITAEVSERLARMQHGEEIVDEAFEAAEKAGVVKQFYGRKDPWGDLTKWHKAEKAKAEIGDDPEAFKAKLRAEVLAELKAGMTAQSVKPPASLAGQTNLGSSAAPLWAGPRSLDEILGTDKKGF